jgi:hypothetical protein
MKPITLIFLVLFGYSNSYAQNDLVIMAQKGKHSKVFDSNERVKVKFSYNGSKEIVVGRIDAVFTDSIYVRGLRKRSKNTIAAIAINDIEKIKNIYTGARTTTGILAMLGATTSTFMVADILSKDAAFFPDASAGTAAGIFAIGLLPYIIVTLTEPSYSQHKGYVFKSVSYKSAPANK